MTDADRERYRQVGADPDGSCGFCGAWLPNEYHEDDCPLVDLLEQVGKRSISDETVKQFDDALLAMRIVQP